MRIKIKILSLALAGAFILSNGNMALAKEYFYDEAINDLPQNTSVSLPEVIGGEDIYLRDVSKNAAILPPPFGSPQAALPTVPDVPYTAGAGEKPLQNSCRYRFVHP